MQTKAPFLIPLMMILVVIPMLATDIYLPAITSMGEDLRASHSALMLTLTSYMAGYSISLLLSGVLSDLLGRRMIVLCGIFTFALASLVSCFVTSVEQLTWCRFFQALGGGCSTLLARVIVRDLYDFKSQVRVLSYLAAGLIASPILGPIIGAFLTINYGWRSIFYALTFFAFISFGLMYFFMRESLASTLPNDSISFINILKKYLKLLTHREFLFHTLVISFAWTVYFSFISSSPGLIQQIYKLSPLEYSYLFSLSISGYIFGTIFIRRNIERMDLKDLIYFSGLIILISTSFLVMFSLLGIDSLFMLLPCIFLSLFGVGVIFPATQAGVTRSFNSDIGLISGLFYSIEMMFGAFASFILSNFSKASWVSTSLLLLCAAVAIFTLSCFDRLFSRRLIDRRAKRFV
ncbi:multidrug effflux MFS transporter [Polynucleobacter sp. MG-27-Goln-C1]|uniref:multidrug effflux MFS transporter n=1 Tax=Polynucleobacter sp. MG-27-Goln-C1 TaxID=1819726 RepID=UPI001C0E152A|nr:multidrug effflux MFS transporter [Polynucleobacter sp. MG-27-Goln-C1]MBU3611466.1 multidrug effflux MFS transporter [Polynucleobacter sp. MG-27-Goln-C1]